MPKINQILLNKKVKDSSYTREILSRLDNVPIIEFEEINFATLKKKYDQPSTLVLTELKGDLLKDCPGTQCYSCCGYKILNVAANCLYQCTYCILQDYFDTTMQIVYADLIDYLPKIEEQISREPSKQRRIGTGEFTDSLIIDDVTHLSTKLIDLFRPHKNVILELKTKSLNIDQVLRTPASDNTVISWSLNTPRMIKAVELKTPSLNKRLAAAKKIVDHGFHVAFHFDPIILYDDCLDEYTQVIDQLFKIIPAERIKWISMGTLRFTKGLKGNFYKRSPVFIDEFIQCDDNKFRYIRHRRVEAYSTILKQIRKYSNTVYTYFCMESQVVWEEVFGDHFTDNQHFELDFNSKVF